LNGISFVSLPARSWVLPTVTCLKGVAPPKNLMWYALKSVVAFFTKHKLTSWTLIVKCQTPVYIIHWAAKKDYKRTVSKINLDKEFKRATPSMWSQYATTSLAIKILRDRCPAPLHNHLMQNLYLERRKPFNGRFYDTSRGKIGRHKLHNRLETLTHLDRPWHEMNLTDAAIRTMLKDYLNFDFKWYFSDLIYLI